MVAPLPKASVASKPSPLCTMLFVLVLCILGFYTLHPPHATLGSAAQRAARFQQVFLSSGTNYSVSSYLRALTQHPHLAGTDQSLETTRFVQAHFESLGLETRTAQYRVLLSYPVHVSLSAHFSNGSSATFSLTEVGQVGPDVVPPYHAYSPSGSANAKAVFANHGAEEDYRALGRIGVSVEGCVVLARKGGALSRGEVVRTAEEKGAVAVLLYADGDGGGGGGFRNGIERGTVMKGVGDPLSPGWASVDGGESLEWDADEVARRFPKIPSMPLSAENAEAILGSLGGAAAPQEWSRRVRWVGPGPTLLNFTYQGEKKMATIHNVFGVIRGSEEPDRYVLLGNHRDAWTYGAVDPNSGTSALLDIARRYALLMRLGWKPRRTIIFCSWDAEEFGMIGSTEWVEQNLVNLGSKAVAYLNVDCAVQGPGFFAGATPQLDDILVEITSKVEDPDSEGATVYEKWGTKNGGVNIQRLSGVDSDFAPFVQHAGVPSVDIYYGKDFPVYHTAFDSYSWMTSYGDPLFQRHVAVAGVWGLLALRLADDSILPFNYMSYANELKLYKHLLSNILDGSISLNPLVKSIEELASAAREAEDEAKKLEEQESKGDFVVLKKRALNDRLMLAERGFIEADGLPGKQWFKHLNLWVILIECWGEPGFNKQEVHGIHIGHPTGPKRLASWVLNVYGPASGHESKLNVFPAIGDAIVRSVSMSRREREATIQHEVWRVARAIQRAAHALRGDIQGFAVHKRE